MDLDPHLEKTLEEREEMARDYLRIYDTGGKILINGPTLSLVIDEQRVVAGKFNSEISDGKLDPSWVNHLPREIFRTIIRLSLYLK